MSDLEVLLDVQAHDLAMDRLRRRHETLESRSALVEAVAEVEALDARLATVSARHDEVVHTIQRLEDEASSMQEHASGVEGRLYSGEITSPRELQALEADLAQLRRRQRSIEDRELECMEQREAVDAESDGIRASRDAAVATAAELTDRLAREEAAIDAEVAAEVAARSSVAAGVESTLLALYERCRAQGNGIGAARLVGSTCQACRLTIPATEVDQIKKGVPGSIAHCDNCGAILVA